MINLWKRKEPLITNGNDKHTILLMHFDGNMKNDAYTNFYSDFNASGVWYANGNFGSGLGNISYEWPTIYTTNNNLLTQLKNAFYGDFTVDYWVYVSNHNFSATMIDVSIGENHSSPSIPVLGLGLYRTYNSNYFIYYLTDRTGLNSGRSGSYPVPSSVFLKWSHIAFEKYGDKLSIFLNGEVIGNPTDFNPESFVASKNSMCLLYSGALDATFSRNYMDELRISSVARYKGQNFTPPTEPYGEPDNQ